MLAKRMTLLAVLPIVFCVSARPVIAQQKSPTVRLVYNGDMASLLSHLAEQYKVQVGFETIPLQPKTAINIETWFDTLDEALNAIVRVDPRYRWQARDGFIDVYPQTGSCPLLETMISEFHVSNTDWSAASQILTSLPEVQNQMSMLHLSRKDLPRTSRRTTVNVLSVSLKGITLRRALHEITKASGGSLWIFERPRGDTQTFSISDLPW